MNLKQSAVAAVIGGALAFLPATPASAFPLPIKPTTPIAADPAKKTPEERIVELEATVKRLTELLDGRRDELGYRLPSDPGMTEEVKALKNRVSTLEAEVAKLKGSTSLKATTTPDPLAGKGTVVVQNNYPIDIKIAVNSNTYTVSAGTEVKIPVTVGDFTYQLLNAGGSVNPVRSPIKEKETVTLRIK